MATPVCPFFRSEGELVCAEKRQAEAARIRDKYPDRIPVRLVALSCTCSSPVILVVADRVTLCLALAQVIVEKAERSEIADIDKKK